MRKDSVYTSTKKYTIYKDSEQWLPFFKWFWIPAPGVTSDWITKHPDSDNMGYGAYPARMIAWLSAKWHTR